MTHRNRRYRECLAGSVLLLGSMLGLLGCRHDGSEASREVMDEANQGRRGRLVVYTDCYPLTFFADTIAGDVAEVHFPVPRDVDPAFWHPTVAEWTAYQKADLILLNGAGYAQWTESVSLPLSRVVVTSQAFQDRYLRLADAVVHKHGPEGEHAHQGLAGHTWLDPSLARLQARAVFEALATRRPAERAALEARWSKLDQELGQWEAALEQLATPDGRPMLASHPVYDYLGRFCRWKLKSVHWEPNETPDEEAWEAFTKLQRECGAACMLWEDEPTAETRTRLEQEFHIRVVPYLPCGNQPEEGDFLTVMRANLERLRAALQ